MWHPAQAGREVFQTRDGGMNLGVWRITNNPAIRDWANYHNTQSWSPDGRYLCYSHHAPDLGRFGDHSIEVHLYDAHKDESRLIARGFNPRWAKQHNWLFYVCIVPDTGSRRGPQVEVRWLDLDSGAHATLAGGEIEMLGETTPDDQWLLGAKRHRGQTPEFVIVRIGIGPKPVVEELREAVGSQLLPNPRHPVFFTRQDHKSDAFGATRWFYDLDGRNKRIAVPTLQQAHMSWLDNGGYLLLGNGLVRGRRWNQPFPSNVDVLAGVGVGDISPCGRSGRYVCGDHHVADLRKPDRPLLRVATGGAQLIPGEEHFETRGYHLVRDDRRITAEPLRPGATLALNAAGVYRPIAVEWSGIESDPGLPLKLDGPAQLAVLAGPPRDFSWSEDRWLVGSGPVSEADARRAAEAVREIVHRHDGVIHREWYRRGVLTQRHDLSAKGKATRRLTFDQGRLSRREYFAPDGDVLSRELLDAAGFVTESIRYNASGEEVDHWWFERGMPVRQVSRGSEYFREGGQWLSKSTGKPWTRERK